MTTGTVIGNDVAYAAELLNRGEVVGIPTETVYGLAANALSKTAVQQIFAIKRRPLFNPLILHMASIEQIDRLANGLPKPALKLLEHFSPGPLTILLPKNKLLPGEITAGLPTMAVRIPRHPLTLALLREVGYPVAAPSANPFGYISPTRAEHVAKMFPEALKYILDGGECTAGIESTIVGFPEGVATVYREGVITTPEIAHIIGPVRKHDGHKPKAPGMLPSHYRPNTPVILCEDPEAELPKYATDKVGLITYNRYAKQLPKDRQILLCTDNDWAGAARNLYAAMHDMDERGYRVIIIRKLPEKGLGISINDRLIRAAAK